MMGLNWNGAVRKCRRMYFGACWRGSGVKEGMFAQYK